MKLKNGKYQYKEGHITENVDRVECDATFWYKNDKLHRENSPAIEYTAGGQEWYLNGLLYTENGTAVEKEDVPNLGILKKNFIEKIDLQ